MKINLMTTAALGLLLSASCFAAPAGAPAGSTGLCKDGSYYSGADKKGACRGHKGVKDWFGDSSATPAAKADKKADTKAEKKAAKAEAKADKAEVKAAMPAAEKAKPAAAPMTPTAANTPVPAGATGLCKDGSYYSGAEKKGACRGHKGIQDWYGAAAPVAAPAAAPTAPAAKPATPTATAPMAAPAKPAAPVPAATASVATPTKTVAAPIAKATTAPAASGGEGMVWANSDSKVYHCSTSRWYGKTKKGEYMTEAHATAQGIRPDHGKTCK